MISEDPPSNFELFPTETWDFFDFLTTPPLFGLIPKFRCFFNWKTSLSSDAKLVDMRAMPFAIFSPFIKLKLEEQNRLNNFKKNYRYSHWHAPSLRRHGSPGQPIACAYISQRYLGHRMVSRSSSKGARDKKYA